MANFIISPYAISYNSIKNSLTAYINNKANSSVLDTWSDFYTAGAGQTVVELDAAIAAFYAFHFIIGRRESYLPTAQNYNAIIGGAEGLGFSASRGHNVYVGFTIIPNQTITIPTWSVIGSYAEYDIVLRETTSITMGEEITLNCVIGNSTAQAYTITSKEIQQFTYTGEDTTDDFRLILNDTVVPTHKNLIDENGNEYQELAELKDAMDGYYITLTNSFGSVDVFYLNNNENDDYNFKANDTLYLQYIQRNDLTFSNLSASTADIDYTSTDIVDLSLIAEKTNVQNKDSVKLAASTYHDTLNVVRARSDFAKILVQNNNLNLIDANDLDINPGLMAVTYLKENGIRLNNTEKTQYYEKVKKASPDGVTRVFIEDPIPIKSTLHINLWQNSGEVVTSDVDTYIQEIIDDYNNTLQPTLDLEAIENALEKIPGVKVARATLDAFEYEYNTKYKPYSIVTKKNILVGNEYEDWNLINSNIITPTNIEVPNWTGTQSVGDKVYDNNIVWERTNHYVSSVPYKWAASSIRNKYDNISVGYTIQRNSTTLNEPKWGNKVSIVDGNVTFNKVKQYSYIAERWAENKRFALDDYVVFERVKENKSDFAVYKATELLHHSGLETPDWTSAENDDENVFDNALTWTRKYDGFDSEKEYNGNNTYIGVQINNYIYIYRLQNSCDSSTIYSTTAKTPLEAFPFDGSDTIYSLRTETVDEVEQLVTDVAIWSLVDTLNYKEWTPYTEFDVGTYTIGNNNVFLLTNDDIAKSGTDTFSELEIWPDTFTDNNVIWTKDTFTLGTEVYPAEGSTWYPETEFYVGEVIIVNGSVNDTERTLIYNVTHSYNQPITDNNVIFTYANQCAVSGNEQPSWTSSEIINGETVEVQSNNVIDGNILWTATKNEPTKEWTSNTIFEVGDIIATEVGNFIFSAIVGTTSEEEPNWIGNEESITDNNIIWRKLGTNTKIKLRWNEYLDLDYKLEHIY